MKKYNIRTYLFLLLTLLSIGSYTYMTSVTTSDTTIKTSEVEEAEKSIYLPDVALIQKIFKTGKQITDKAL